MTTLDDRQGITPANIPATRPKRSGCALRHTEAECDCYPPDSPAPRTVGCRECWGDGNPCGACGGWGETYRSGARLHHRVAGSGATGPSTARNTDGWDIAPDDPWADATSVIDIPFFCAPHRPHGRFEMPC